MKRAGVLAAAAMLPAVAAAQSNSAAPQANPGINFNLPPSPRPTPQAAPTSGPIIAPFNRPLPTQTPIVVPLSMPTPRATAAPTPTGTPAAAPTRRPATAAPVVRPTPTPTASAAPAPQASTSPAPLATETPAAVPTTAPSPVAAPPETSGSSSSTMIAGGVALLALLAAGWFLFGRRRRVEEEIVEPLPEPIAAPAPPPEPVAPPAPAPAPTGHITIPVRRRAIEEDAPRIEITLIPRRAGTNLTSAAVDYRVLVRNAGAVAARDIRMAMYMLSASARQTQDLQSIFTAPVEQPVVPPFELAPGGEIDLSGIAQLPRDQVNVMTIDGKPWFVPVLALKAEYRWGDNVGAPGVATAAHMIGIDRGAGAKMAPFRFDGNPRMHPEVAERKVA